MSGFDKNKTAPQFLDLLTQHKNAALLRSAKTALWRSWRTTSFLLILSWTIALMGSRVLITNTHTIEGVSFFATYTSYIFIAGILTSIIYFFINQSRVLKYED